MKCLIEIDALGWPRELIKPVHYPDKHSVHPGFVRDKLEKGFVINRLFLEVRNERGQLINFF